MVVTLRRLSHKLKKGRWSLRVQKLATEQDPSARRGRMKTVEGWRGWLEGRTWLSKDFAKRGEKTVCFSWSLGKLGLDAKVYLGPCGMNDGQDDGVTLHAAVPGMSVFLGFERIVPAWLLPGGRPVKARKGIHRAYTPGREIGVSVHDGSLWVSVWERGDGSWARNDPWWSKVQCLRPVELVLGKLDTSESTKQDLGTVEIPMPEGVYKATATLCRHVWKRRGFAVKRWWRIGFDDFEGPDGIDSIPYPGKGTTSYNCGMDGCYGVSAPSGLELPDAIGYVVSDVLRTRLKRTGNAFWKPEPKTEAV